MSDQRGTHPDYFVRTMLIVAFCSAVVIGVTLVQRYRTPPGPLSGRTLPPASGPDLLAIYIGNADCGGSKLPGFREVEQQTMSELRQLAIADHERFVRVGVSIDQSPDVGRSYLRPFGPFDELALGDGFLNIGAVSYLWRDNPGEVALPQIVVIRRDVQLTDAGVIVGRDSVLGRLIGIDGMQDWLARRKRAAAVSKASGTVAFSGSPE